MVRTTASIESEIHIDERKHHAYDRKVVDVLIYTPDTVGMTFPLEGQLYGLENETLNRILVEKWKIIGTYGADEDYCIVADVSDGDNVQIVITGHDEAMYSDEIVVWERNGPSHEVKLTWGDFEGHDRFDLGDAV